MTEWISVKDRLPEKSGDYIVAFDYGDVGSLLYSERHKAFNALDFQAEATSRIDNVTHWMPLPEPPEKERV